MVAPTAKARTQSPVKGQPAPSIPHIPAFLESASTFAAKSSVSPSTPVHAFCNLFNSSFAFAFSSRLAALPRLSVTVMIRARNAPIWFLTCTESAHQTSRVSLGMRYVAYVLLRLVQIKERRQWVWAGGRLRVLCAGCGIRHSCWLRLMDDALRTLVLRVQQRKAFESHMGS